LSRTSERIIATPVGEGRIVTRRAARPIATVLLSHGAGGGIEARDLTALATYLPRQGVNVMLFEQPWRRAGRKVATPPATLDVGLRAAVDAIRVRTPLILGGRSAGARSACRSARALSAAGCLALSFPLHPPGKPESSRLEELAGCGVPTLVIQGGNDPFGGPEEFPDPLPPGTDLAVVPDADHGLKVPKRSPISQDDAMGIVVEAALEWIVREIVGNGAPR
jgi:uncharacterized protein